MCPPDCLYSYFKGLSEKLFFCHSRRLPLKAPRLKISGTSLIRGFYPSPSDSIGDRTIRGRIQFFYNQQVMDASPNVSVGDRDIRA